MLLLGDEVDCEVEGENDVGDANGVKMMLIRKVMLRKMMIRISALVWNLMVWKVMFRKMMMRRNSGVEPDNVEGVVEEDDDDEEFNVDVEPDVLLVVRKVMVVRVLVQLFMK